MICVIKYVFCRRKVNMFVLKTVLIGLVWAAFVFSADALPNIVLIIADDLVSS